MSTFVIGDIHGHLLPLEDVLAQIRSETSDRDTLVFLGDYIDRGPSSKACVDAILGFREETPATVVCLRGNHEDWLLRTLGDYQRHSWLLGMEAFDTIRSYSAEAADALRAAARAAGGKLYLGKHELPYDIFFAAVPEAHLRFFQSLVFSHRTADCLCTHAGIDPQIPAHEDQDVRALVWGASSFPDRYEGTETIVYGHMNNADIDSTGWPRPHVAGNTIGIDTIAHGVLTAIRLPGQRLFQSRLYPSAIRHDD
jgi:serine/threonine protein phosphatase 1